MTFEKDIIGKIVSEWQYQALRKEGYLILKEEYVRKAIKFEDWRHSIIKDAADILDQVDRSNPNERGYNRLRDLIDKLDGIEE